MLHGASDGDLGLGAALVTEGHPIPAARLTDDHEFGRLPLGDVTGPLGVALLTDGPDDDPSLVEAAATERTPAAASNGQTTMAAPPTVSQAPQEGRVDQTRRIARERGLTDDEVRIAISRNQL